MAVLGRHDGPVEGVSPVGDRFAATASTDGTVRLWDVAHAVEHALVAGPDPFHAVASGADGRRLVARAGVDALWLLDVDAPAEEPEAMVTGGLEEVAEWADGIPVLLRCGMVSGWPYELRAVQVTFAAPGEPAGRAVPLRLAVGPEPRCFEPLGPDGRLRVPRRLPRGRQVTLWIRVDRADASSAGTSTSGTSSSGTSSSGTSSSGTEDRNPRTLRLAFVTPFRQDERWSEAELFPDAAGNAPI
jgi:hypothetical protein